MPAVSVIVPIYNVAQYVERGARALMAQTFEDVEFIFVDDASPDDSIDRVKAIVKEYPHRQVKFLAHEKNLGLPSARKTGFAVATGEFIYNCDADDWLEPDLLEKMYRAAQANDADYVYCDYYLSFETNERYMHHKAYATPDEMLRKGFLMGACKYNYWNKLVKRELYEGVVFPVEHRKGGEDMVMIGILSRAKRLAYVPEALYHYRQTNSGAISHSFSEQRLLDVHCNADSTLKDLENYPGDLSLERELFKLNVKLQFIITDEKRRYAVWKEWYPEANAYVFKNPELPFRTKLVQWFAAKNLWPLVKAYYLLVYKFVYGVIFK